MARIAARALRGESVDVRCLVILTTKAGDVGFARVNLSAPPASPDVNVGTNTGYAGKAQ